MSNSKNLLEYYTVGKAAKYLGVSSATLRNWDKSGKLIAYRNPLNGYRLYSKSDLDRLLNQISREIIDTNE